jgi:hypothetical protein
MQVERKRAQPSGYALLRLCGSKKRRFPSGMTNKKAKLNVQRAAGKRQRAMQSIGYAAFSGGYI